VSHLQNLGTDKEAQGYPARAIILISGPSNPSVCAETEAVLLQYKLQITDRQVIDMAGRLIVAFLISLDPAHAKAIEVELLEKMEKFAVDVALEVL
jgi:predicted amino acid-binding ACT domain protein